MNALLKLAERTVDLHLEAQKASLHEIIKEHQSDAPLYCFCPEQLRSTYRQFRQLFPGRVTYAVKANPTAEIVQTLVQEGMTAFDVASLSEIELIRRHSAFAALHYNNPIRSQKENHRAFHDFKVRSYAVDSVNELEKLANTVGQKAGDVEVSVRFHLDLGGAGYDFGTKFGASTNNAVALVKQAKQLGFKVSLSFHPGSQCRVAEAYRDYVYAAADIAKCAKVQLFRLNVGGGFPVTFPDDQVEGLEVYMKAISKAVDNSFADYRPELLCEPGRAMVASSVALLTKVKAIKDDGRLYLNDGVYGGFQESHIIRLLPRYQVFDSSGHLKNGEARDFVVFGPTCDSMDQLPGKLALPTSIAEEDTIVFYDMGAYGSATTTNFNGYNSANYQRVSSFN